MTLLIDNSNDNPGKFFITCSEYGALGKKGLYNGDLFNVLGKLHQGKGDRNYYYNSVREAIQCIKKFYKVKPAIKGSNRHYETKA